MKEVLKTAQTSTVSIDASGEVIGRVATEVARKLLGKDRVDFRRDRHPDLTVTVKNVRNMRISPKRMNTKVYYRHSSYPGGLKTTSLKSLFADKPEEVLRKAVRSMLPNNRLRNVAMKRLRFE